MSLYENINRRRKLGISRSKADSTVSKSSYSNMEKGFPKKAATGKIINTQNKVDGVITGLKKASKMHAGQAKTLEKLTFGKVKKFGMGGKIIKAKVGVVAKKPSLMEKAGKATAALYKKLPEEGLISKGKRAAKKIASKAKNLFKAAPAAGTGKTLDKAKELAKYTGKIGKASKLAKASRLARIARVATPVGLALLAGEAVYKTANLSPEAKARVKAKKKLLRKKSTKDYHDDLASPSGRSTRKIKKKAAGGTMKFNKGGFATNYYKGLI